MKYITILLYIYAMYCISKVKKNENERDIPLLFIPYIVLFVIEETKWRNLHKSHYVQDTPTEKKTTKKTHEKHTLFRLNIRCHFVWIGSMSFRIDRNYACWYFFCRFLWMYFFLRLFFSLTQWVEYIQHSTQHSIQLKFMLNIFSKLALGFTITTKDMNMEVNLYYNIVHHKIYLLRKTIQSRLTF